MNTLGFLLTNCCIILSYILCCLGILHIKCYAHEYNLSMMKLHEMAVANYYCHFRGVIQIIFFGQSASFLIISMRNLLHQ